jgi:hypothetical protein
LAPHFLSFPFSIGQQIHGRIFLTQELDAFGPRAQLVGVLGIVLGNAQLATSQTTNPASIFFIILLTVCLSDRIQPLSSSHHHRRFPSGRSRVIPMAPRAGIEDHLLLPHASVLLSPIRISMPYSPKTRIALRMAGPIVTGRSG